MDFTTLTLDRTGGLPLYRQVCDALAAAIGGGDIRPGERLPSERDLAGCLSLSRTTVVNAYRELQARGLVRGHVGRGTVVCAEPESDGAPFAWRGKVAVAAQRTMDTSLRTLVRSAEDTDLISLAAGAAALECFPLDDFRERCDAVLRDNPAGALGLGPTEGQPEFRRALAARFGARPEQVLVLTGGQQGLDLIARCLLDPGDYVVMDRPGYLGAIQTFRAAGARIAGWDLARADLGELEDLLLRYRPKLLYTNPTFQNPTGRVLPAADRRDLLGLAARYRLPVVEDEPYRALGFGTEPPPTLFHLDRHDLVIHLSTYSKTLASGLRLGWLAAAPAVVEQLTLIKQRSDVFSPSLPQLVVAGMLRDGRLDAHIETLRLEHARRHHAMDAALQRQMPPGSMSFAPVTGGIFLWCRLHPSIDGEAVLVEADRAGVSYVRGDLFYADRAGAQEMRLCFSATAAARIDEGIRRLAGAVTSARRRRTVDEGTRSVD
ncbi:MAG: PLP-dependent aminotransferase family protein [Dehalococcoidia bacterium]